MTLTWSMLKRCSGRTLLLAAYILICALPAFSQQTGLDDLGDQTPRLMLALSTADYPATPGDVYNLSYYASITGGSAAAISIPIVMDAGYQLKIQNMGTINARNKTYLQVRREVENLVSRNYPMSGPTLTLVRMGNFTVPVTGETTNTGNRSVDGLTRVSALSSLLTGKASIRFIRVIGANGNTKTYDLFTAARNGDLSQNPYVSPGDRVVIPVAGRIVRLRGEVYRAGSYELLEDEQLEELIEKYGGGFTKEAALDKLAITRLDPRLEKSRELITLSWQAKGAVMLQDGDVVDIANRESNRQAVFFEGAVFSVAEGEELKDRDERSHAVTRIPYYFSPGETLGRAGRNVRAYFSDVSDLSAAYILRGTEQIAVNLERFLYRNDTTGDIPLESGDVIVVPYRRFYTMIGEVNVAGDRPLDTLERLSSLLTGLSEKASSRLATVTSANGTPQTYDLFQTRRFGDLSQDPYIRPGDKIQVPPAGRKVSIAGEVFRPGTYELLPGEEMESLIGYYGDGFTLDAAPEKILLTRAGKNSAVSREMRFLSWDNDRGLALEDGDHLVVENRNGNRQAVFFEGALFSVAEGEELKDRDERSHAVTRIPYYFSPGETLGRAGRNVRAYFSDVSDLSAAYMLRGAEQITVNLERFLYQNETAGDIPLESGDVIVIPYRRFYTMTGEVNVAGNRPLDTLERLSSLFTGLSEKASSRLAIVTSANGTMQTYDLFQSRRFGDLSQDPYIRPGDRIQIPPAGRKVALAGEVFRPGTYELLPGENLESLVTYYGDGFTLEADPSRLKLTRIHAQTAGETKIFPYSGNAAMILEDRDSITVANKAAMRPVVFFEGALSRGEGPVEQTGTAIEGTAKMEHPFYEGETLGNAARANAGRFTASSDLANVYVIRNGNNIPMDLTRHLYYNDFSRDLALENGDIIVIPFRQYFVLVSGAVKLPGRYPYVPDRLAEYYINLAGGRDELLNNGRGITVTDINKNRGKLRADALITPETMIWVPTNRFSAHFSQYGPIITTILSIVSTVLTIFAVTGNL